MKKKQRLSNGVELSYYDSGSGRAVVFLHSFGHNKTMWLPQLTHVLERGWRVVAPDMPGHGDSTFDPARQSVAAIARGYLELFDAIGLQRVVLVATSMGGYLALNMWAAKPDAISALVLANTKAERDSDEIVSRRRAQIASIERHGLEEFVRTTAPKRVSPRTVAERPWVVDAISMMNFTSSAQASAATLAAMTEREDDTTMLNTITVPTLIIEGGDDTFIPKGAAAAMRDGIRNSRLHTIEGTGHISNLEKPTEFNRLLDEFLTSLP